MMELHTDLVTNEKYSTTQVKELLSRNIFEVEASEDPNVFMCIMENYKFFVSKAVLERIVSYQTKAQKLCDWQIKQRCILHNMIEPFVDHQVRHENDDPNKRKIISYGLTSYGYDIRLAGEYKVFTNARSGIIDPLNFDADEVMLDLKQRPYCDIPPNSYILARTLERFQMPANMVADAIGKSSYARCGLIINLTPLEPSWTGYLTLELANATNCPLRVYSGMGIAQIRFYEGPPPHVNYTNRPYGIGKYQDQPPEPITVRT